MVKPSGGVQQAGGDIVGLKVRKICKYLLVRLASRQHLQHINDTRPQATNARTTAALLRANGYALQ